MATPAGGEGRGPTAASPGRSGRGRGRRNGRGRGRGKNKPRSDNDNDDAKNGEKGSASSDATSKSNGGRGGARSGRRHFSARGGGGAGRGNGASSSAGAGRGSAAAAGETELSVAAIATPHTQTLKDDNGAEAKVKNMTDQDVLIAFGPFVRSGNPNAKRIHTEYLSNSRQKDFIQNARKFLVHIEGRPQTQPAPPVVVSAAEDKQNNAQSIPIRSGLKAEPMPQDAMRNIVNNTQQPALQQHQTAPGAPASLPRPPPPPGMMQAAPPGLQVQPIGLAGVQTVNNNGVPAPRLPPGLPPGLSMQPPPQSQLPPGPPPGMPPAMRPPKTELPPATMLPPKNNPTSSILPARTPQKEASKAKGTKAAPATPARPVKVRRTQTRCEEQPGRLFANDIPAAAFNSAPNRSGTSLTVRPRSELTARWVLPLPYLRNRALRRFEELKAKNGAPPQALTIRDALDNLAVGLFRRGAMDSGSQSSIVSKEILASSSDKDSGRPAEDYFFNVDQQTDSVFGTVPFYAPRTPGNVVFRLYFDDEPQVTLATGPCIHVIPGDGDIDSVLRFILSNFKSKKTNGISSMNSLASVLELFSPRQTDRYFDQAGRVAWGCISEARKVVEKAGEKYIKTKEDLEEKAEAAKLVEELPDLKTLVVNDTDTPKEEKSDEEKEKEKQDKINEAEAKLATEKFTNERKWRDMQLVYASILKAAINNEANRLLLKRDVLAKIRLEYDLWCPLTESFAPNPFSTSNDELLKLPGVLAFYPHSITKDRVKECDDSVQKMQKEVMGFVPVKTKGLNRKKNGRSYLQELSTAMNQIYMEDYAVSDQVWKRRESVRSRIEEVMSASGEFPAGTKVAVFGSSANGFGSPNSDLDLCLQVPPSATNFTKENGVEAMTKLATKFTEAGMTDVDTVRLTARIPIVKFNVPYNDGGKEILVECDLSLQNPLACLNTSLLHTYSKISPTTCILASIIKRWAKARDINNPSQHTLSSYGYVIMLINFLTSCDFTKDGHVVDSEKTSDVNPIIPNLQWVDPTFAQNPIGPYREIPARPKTQHTMIQHPNEVGYLVNSYFWRTGLDGLRQFCCNNHNPEMALGSLLASFFYFYAYEFDYKKHVISLNRKHCSPEVEREVKAEEDGWSLFRHGLAIADPFEGFYDVAHVVRGPNFAHIRKEFSLAYTKIASAAQTHGELPTGREVIDLICESVSNDEEGTA